MPQNTLNPSNLHFKSDNIPSSFFDKPLTQTTGPFVVSKPCNQKVLKHEVSTMANWTNSQKEKYSIFILYFREVVHEESYAKNTWAVFKGMSKYIKTRNPQQCRSHHLKLIKQFKEINKFIELVKDRVPKLKEKILLAENQLGEIQNQFNLYPNQPSIKNFSSVLENRLFNQEAQQAHLRGEATFSKGDKQQFIKTADSYIQQKQNPVKSNNKSSEFLGSRFQFKPFDTFNSKSNRSSLPSFGDSQKQQLEVKQQNKLFDTFKRETQVEAPNLINFPFETAHLNPLQQNFNMPSNSFSGFENQAQNMQKMKEFLECHYLFQLWTSKLEKIMRQS